MIIPIVLSGGNGTRLWPLSRKERPKQFIELINNDTLFTGTLKRFENSEIFQKPVILANVAHKHLLDREIEINKLKEPLIVLEPEARNTAAAIATVTELLNEQGKGDEVAIFIPSDAFIDDPGQYEEYLREGECLAWENKMVCFGIKPTYPESGYGYIKIKKKFQDNSYGVDKFVEKPDLKTAISFLKTGKYLWNSGMFMCKIGVLSELFGTHCGELQNSVRGIIRHSSYSGNVLSLDSSYSLECKNISFDYAIMEKLDERQIMVVSMNLLWSDVGSYASLFSINRDRTEDNNVLYGEVVLNNTSNCYIRSGGKTICCSDLDDLVIVEEDDVILVMKKSKSQNIKKLVDLIGEKNPSLR
ncbi:MAG: hypothetical protein LBI70_03275 [Rickettsiales bacterium]|jgi:mannose-1-phosphate guanylyltransferase/mannose-6-phosphate isomerase|nr:hypothetical protein [Rickettsiales bacterium]